MEGTILAGGALAFNTLVMGQLLHAYSCRSRRRLAGNAGERNRKLDLAIGGSLALQLLANVVPGLRGLLVLGAASALDIGVMFAGAGMPLLLNEATKPPTKKEVDTGKT